MKIVGALKEAKKLKLTSKCTISSPSLEMYQQSTSSFVFWLFRDQFTDGLEKIELMAKILRANDWVVDTK